MNLLPTGSRYMEASFSFSEIRTLYSSTLGQAIPSAFGHYDSAETRIAKHKNNLFGLNATGKDPYNKAFSFKTKGDSVQKFGHIISEYYVDKGLTSIDKVAQKYCGVNTNWSALVKSIMKSDYKKISQNISL